MKFLNFAIISCLALTSIIYSSNAEQKISNITTIPPKGVIETKTKQFSIKNYSSFVDIPDEGLLTLINKELGKGEYCYDSVTYSELLLIEKLDFPYHSMCENLEGIQYAENLKKLDLSEQYSLSNISQLQYLHNLESLRLPQTDVTDISPIKDLTKLNTIDLSGLRLHDISPLNKLLETNTFKELTLSRLYIGGDTFLDLEALSKQIQITKLDLGEMSCSSGTGFDFDFLENFRSLEYLNLNEWNASILIDSISKNLNLKHLNILGGTVYDISNLKDLKNLESFKVEGVYLKGLSGIEIISNFTKLSELYIESCNLSNEDFSFLLNLNNLTHLSLNHNNIDNFNHPNFNNLKSLKHLYIEGNNLKTLNLEKMPLLEYLSIRGNHFTDLIQFKPYTNIDIQAYNQLVVLPEKNAFGENYSVEFEVYGLDGELITPDTVYPEKYVLTNNSATWTPENSGTYNCRFNFGYSKNNIDYSIRIEQKVNFKKADSIPPTVSHTISPENATDRDVLIHLNAFDEEGIKRIVLPSGNSIYSDSIQYSVNINGLYSFCIEDINGNFLVFSVKVSNIDKTKPNLNIITDSTTEWSNQDINVKIIANDN